MMIFNIIMTICCALGFGLCIYVLGAFKGVDLVFKLLISTYVEEKMKEENTEEEKK